MQDIRIVFLGTSAGTPTRERNVAGVAVVLDGRVLLLDCGEGTQHQFLRAPVRSGALEAIFISHLHGDHLFGLPGLLASLGLQGRVAPLTVFGPAGLRAYLESIPYGGRSYPVTVVEIEAGEVHRGDGYRVFTASLEHSAPCFGFAIVEDDHRGPFDPDRARTLGVPAGPLFARLHRGEDVTLDDGRVVRSSEVVGPSRRGRRVVYCTDTRPCAAAIGLARDADLLVHEATYANELAAEAAERHHSTAAEAAAV
ncbi:MAG TPA: ribonuclease Z, partial [Thermoanaerobaculia bacterium]